MKIEEYNKNPTICKNCNSTINYCKGIQNKKFCNIKCSTNYNNKLNKNTIEPHVCLNCNSTFNAYKTDRKFCSPKCSSDHVHKSTVQKWLNKEITGWTGKAKQLCGFVRKYLYSTRGTACSECGWDEKHPIDNLPLTEVDHIDGNAENCDPSNLRILCPNCHSMTPTYRARNKNGRKDRYT